MTESVQRSADDPHSKAACDWYPVMSQKGLRGYNAGPDSDRNNVRYNVRCNRVRTTPVPLARPARRDDAR